MSNNGNECPLRGLMIGGPSAHACFRTVLMRSSYIMYMHGYEMCFGFGNV